MWITAASNGAGHGRQNFRCAAHRNLFGRHPQRERHAHRPASACCVSVGSAPAGGSFLSPGAWFSLRTFAGLDRATLAWHSQPPCCCASVKQCEARPVERAFDARVALAIATAIWRRRGRPVGCAMGELGCGPLTGDCRKLQSPSTRCRCQGHPIVAVPVFRAGPALSNAASSTFSDRGKDRAAVGKVTAIHRFERAPMKGEMWPRPRRRA